MFDLFYNMIESDLLGLTQQHYIDFPILEDYVMFLTILLLAFVLLAMMRLSVYIFKFTASLFIRI